MSDEIALSVQFTARVDAARGAIAAGSPIVYDSAASAWVLSTSANRATAGARTQAFALTVLGGSIVSGVSYQQAGVLAAALSDIGAGAQQLVRVTSGGGLQRVATYTPGDDIIGLAEPDGRVHLFCGLPMTQIIAAASAGSTAINAHEMSFYGGRYQIPTSAPSLAIGKRVIAYSNFSAGTPTSIFFFSYLDTLTPGIVVTVELCDSSGVAIATGTSSGATTGAETVAFPVTVGAVPDGFRCFVRVSKTGGNDSDGVVLTNAFLVVTFP